MNRFPPHLIFELTAKCNYRCPFCYCVWHEFPELAKPERDTQFWKNLLDSCAENGVGDLLFTGGEAMLRPDLSELLTYARKILPEAELGLFTNGSRLTEEFLRFCRRKRIRLSTSLQGLKSYGEMTGTKRSYRRTLEWIARAAELKWKMSVSLTATQANRHEFADMFCAVAVSGALNIQMGAMMPEGRGRGHLELTLSRPEWEELKAEIRALPDCGVPYAFCDEMICECRTQPAAIRRRFEQPPPSECPAGKSFAAVGPNGKIRKCLHDPAETELSSRRCRASAG